MVGLNFCVLSDKDGYKFVYNGYGLYDIELCCVKFKEFIIIWFFWFFIMVFKFGYYLFIICFNFCNNLEM